MQLDLFWRGKEEIPTSPDVLPLDAVRQVPILFRRNNQARRYLLRLHTDGTARVTIPRRGSLKYAREFAASHKDWLLQQLLRWEARPKAPREWGVGTELLFRGETARLEFSADNQFVLWAGERVRLRAGASVRRQVEAHLQKISQRELPPRLLALAEQHGCRVTRVSVRNQRSRWGSCSARGTISLNWRLVQMPPAVSDYIMLHELMHTREMNHSRRFWARVGEVCPDYEACERWIKQHGARLGLR